MIHNVGRCRPKRLLAGEGPGGRSGRRPATRTGRPMGTNGAVSAGGREAVAAGLEILKRGGNAADAAAATILALSVTDSRSFCFGGEVPILVYDARTKGVTVIAGQGAAPRLATREDFVRRGGIPLRGIEAAAVPAALDACLTLLDRFGTMSFAQVDRADAAVARPPAASRGLARRLRADARDARRRRGPGLSRGPASPAGDRSRGLRLVADAFYRGPIARRIDAWSRRQRRADPLRRPGHPHDADRGAGLGHVSRPDRLPSAGRGPRGRTCSRPCRSSRASTSSRWDTTAPRRSTRSSRRSSWPWPTATPITPIRSSPTCRWRRSSCRNMPPGGGR